MPNENKYDAVVVGARCAGAATAMLLARRGMRVLALDRAPYGTDTTSTHALMRGGVLQLRRWGVLPRLLEVGTPPVRTTTFHYGDEAVEVAVKSELGIDALYAPRRTVLDSVLVDAAQEAGVEIRHGHALTELTRRTDGRVDGAIVLGPDGTAVRIAADLVIGADGSGSLVARLTRAATTHSASHSSAVIYGHWPTIRAQGYHWFYRPGLSAGAIPTNAGHRCIFVAVPQARFRQELRHDVVGAYHRLLAEVTPNLASDIGGSAQQARLSVFAGRTGFLRQPWGPGWALVGDAGYFKDPLTAHGITDALRDAALLADAAVVGTDAAYRNYHEIRDELSLPLFKATEAIAAFRWTVDELRTHHLAINKAMKHEVAYLSSHTHELSHQE
jgi:menaquinone-9 beta-reductase